MSGPDAPGKGWYWVAGALALGSTLAAVALIAWLILPLGSDVRGWVELMDNKPIARPQPTNTSATAPKIDHSRRGRKSAPAEKTRGSNVPSTRTRCLPGCTARNCATATRREFPHSELAPKVAPTSNSRPLASSMARMRAPAGSLSGAS